MKCVVLVPGILGSELVDSNHRTTVWPPTVWEMVRGYKRIGSLLANGLQPNGLIRKIAFYGVYESIQDDIGRCGYTINDPAKRLIEFSYDWRRSNADSARKLADRLNALEDPTEITLIGHSMGGLVLRYLLESGEFNDRPWFDKITTLITMGTPHFGSPNALSNLLGKEPSLGVSGADMLKLAHDSRYPSVYQLIASPQTALTISGPRHGSIPQKLDPFSPGIAAGMSLNAQNIQSARKFWDELGFEKKPDHVEYFFFGGAAHKTTVRNEWEKSTGTLTPVERRQAGDGTVPVTCSIVPGIPHGFSEKKHAKIFEDRDLRELLYKFLEAPAGVRPQAAGADGDVGQPDAVGLSVNKETYRVGESIEIAASYTNPITDPEEYLSIVKIDVDTRQPDEATPAIPIDAVFKGVTLTSFTIVTNVNLTPGIYQLTTTRTTDDPAPAYFFVNGDE